MNSVYGYMKDTCLWAYERKWADTLAQIPASIYKICCTITTLFKNCFLPEKGEHPFVSSLKNDISPTRKRVADLTSNIRTLDAFIESHPEMRKIVAKHLLKYGQYTAKARVIYEPDSADNDIQAWSKLKRYEIDLELLWDKRVLFIESHKKVRACMIKHILKVMQDPNPSIKHRKVLSLLPFFDKESNVSLSRKQSI